MPNWCQNWLTVEGDPDEVQRFRNENTFVEVGPEAGMADGDTRVLPLSFEAQYPTPRDENGELYKGKGTMPDWYNWRVDNWGTKWDLSSETEVEHDVDDGYIRYTFDSAWAPPVAWLAQVCTKYPDLHFNLSYEEMGMCFQGEAEASGGELIRDDTWDAEYDDERCEMVPV